VFVCYPLSAYDEEAAAITILHTESLKKEGLSIYRWCPALVRVRVRAKLRVRVGVLGLGLGLVGWG
jgi:hypothetical protein